ncbi:tumor necrosis factor receptor superfamily member 17 [Salmo salar]|uniref:Tumor necrosis factor receptor superfamily member 17 n=1 Tax=Salmo salar TaxID=8030 RepID=A0A1S3Q3A5_SALSA|nr:tumor necrosis factor receptor superfamily member 17 [Salmo salar]|eukprot:XP_014034440.1 PREDICTED: tumor necrosis factor receptor superfamily member 17 [Salmo salar]
MSEGQCGLGYYYDGLVEECKQCYLRCNSPPRVCTTYCTQSSESKAPEPFNIRLTLVWLFVFLCAFTTLLLLLQVLRKKTCRRFPRNKLSRLQEAECPGTERVSYDVPEQTVVIMGQDSLTSGAGAMVLQEGTNSQTPDCNANLPVPSTEEGTTILVTTKTVQIFNHTD